MTSTSASTSTEPRPPRRALHLIRAASGAAQCVPEPGDRVVHLEGGANPAELVALIFEHDAVIVW